jgi:GNAT superfamily N-acetyltransferase
MIEVVTSENLRELLPLISEYQRFYQVENMSDAKNEAFFSQFGETNSQGCQFLFRDNGEILGFATIYFTFSSTLAEKVAQLNDLYTVPHARNRGIGRALIDHCRDYALQHGAIRLQWLTAKSNAEAQYLYDRMNTSKSDWCFYALS